MGALDKVLGAMGLQRVRPRAPAKRLYAAAKQDRLNTDWVTSHQSADSEIRAALKVLRARSRALTRDDPYMRKFVGLVAKNVVGPTGVRLQARVRGATGPDRDLNAAIERAWAAWGRLGTCTVDGELSWTDVQQLVATAVARDGEVLLRLISGPSAGNEFGFALQVFEADHLEDDDNGVLPDGRTVSMGVVKNRWSRPVAYRLWTQHPGDTYPLRPAGRQVMEIPAGEMLHIRLIERPGQTRGVPWCHAAVTRLRHLGSYEEAELIAARVGASKMGFFTTPTGDQYVGEGEDASGNLMTEVEPGVFGQLPAGVDFKSFTPDHPNTGFSAFMKTTLRGVSAGLDVAYNGLANDLEGVNYSSIRQGSLDERDTWRRLQHWLIAQLHNRVYRQWIEFAVAAGQVAVPDARVPDLMDVQWQPRGWQWVDPLKEVQAAREAVAAGFKSRTEVLAEQGRDFEDTLDELAAEEALAAEKGVTLAAEAAATPPPPPESTDSTDAVDDAPRGGPLRVVRHSGAMNMAKGKTLKLPRMSRLGEIRAAAPPAEGEADDRLVEVSFSSETAVDRWFGTEILDHKSKSIRLDWMKSKRAPLLVDHRMEDQIGVIEKAWLTDKVGHATIRFGQSARASEILADVRDGIRVNISVGYRIHKMVREEVQKDLAVYRAVDWEPMEISIVSIPADPGVGVGRDLGDTTDIPVEEAAMATEDTSTEQTRSAPATPAPAPTVPPVLATDLDKARREAREQEQTRIREITDLCARHANRIPNIQKIRDDAINGGTPLAEFRGQLLSAMPEMTPLQPSVADLGLSDSEARSYSFIRMVNSILNQNNRKLAPFEWECHDAVQKRLTTKVARGVFIPVDVQRAGALGQAHNIQQRLIDRFGRMHGLSGRDLNVTTDSAGGYLVATQHLGGSFIDVLRALMMTRALGATVLTGLVGDVSIPKKTAASSASWVAEGSAPSEGSLTFGSVNMTPKSVTTFVDYTRRLVLQSSPDIEQIVREDLAEGIAQAIDIAAINGSGSSNQPTGVLNTSGIGSVAIGTNGGAPTWATIVGLESAVANVNALRGRPAYLTNSAARGKFKQVTKVSSDAGAGFLWDRSGAPLIPGEGEMNGYRAAVSNNVPSDGTKGSGTALSAAIFGNWADLLIGEWGVLDLLVDPYTGSSAGNIRVRVFQDVDVGVRIAASFAACEDIVTT